MITRFRSLRGYGDTTLQKVPDRLNSAALRQLRTPARLKLLTDLCHGQQARSVTATMRRRIRSHAKYIQLQCKSAGNGTMQRGAVIRGEEAPILYMYAGGT